MTSTSVSHVTDVGSQSAPAGTCRLRDLRVAPSGDRLQSTPVDHLGDGLGRVRPQSPVGQPLAQLGDAQLALDRQGRRLDAVNVRMFAVFFVPGSQDRHGASWQRSRPTSATNNIHNQSLSVSHEVQFSF